MVPSRNQKFENTGITQEIDRQEGRKEHGRGICWCMSPARSLEQLQLATRVFFYQREWGFRTEVKPAAAGDLQSYA